MVTIFTGRVTIMVNVNKYQKEKGLGKN